MIGIGKVISTVKDASKRLQVKILFRGKIAGGKGDVRTPLEASPFGCDTNPTEGKVAVYAKTGVDGQYYLLGYLNTERLAEVGENRQFSTDANGAFKFNIWQRADGTVLIGDSKVPAAYTNYFVKFNELKVEDDKTVAYVAALRAATQAMATAMDALIPGTSAAFSAAMAGQVLGNVASSKNEKVKTI